MPDLNDILHRTFGFTGFRANQEAVCRAATDGRDVLLVMPTGAGKSLCYQLPAVARGGTALVISPLIALMDDQANKLTAAGLQVGRIHSGLSREQSRQACRDYLDGKLQFLFIAPERMRVPGFPEMLAKRKPALIAIDEAHCISAWGHDFRPDYRLLGEYLPALRPAPVIALTATATPQVQRDIVAQLQLENPALFIHGFRRENLAVEVVEMSKPRRTQFTADFLADTARRPAIVYAPSRRVAEELATELGQRFPAAAYHAGLAPEVRAHVQRQFQAGKLEVVVATIAFGMGIDKADVRSVVHFALPASVEAFYQEIGRAGRDGLHSRTVLLYSFVDRRIHETFLERDYPPVEDLARVAKGLTDEFLMPEFVAAKLKMNRDVVAKSLDKLAAQGAAQFDIGGNVRRTDATGWQTGYRQQVEFRRAQIDAMMAFAETQQCRMTALIRHFGDTADAHRPCGHCDFCAPSANSAQPFVAPTGAQERDLRSILRALDGMPRSTGKLHSELALTPDRKVFDSLLEGLARAGLITLNPDTFTNPEGKVITYRKAAITQDGRTLGAGEPLGVLLRVEVAAAVKKAKKKAAPAAMPIVTKPTAAPKPARLFAESTPGPRSAGAGAKPQEFRRERATASDPDQALNADQQVLEHRLRAWRKSESEKMGLPQFFVLGTSTLRNIVLSHPRTLAQLQKINGIGDEKLERFGPAILELCNG
jgi:ATP-dependent DNA helicase RecQ